jgi:hypothetical protein
VIEIEVNGDALGSCETRSGLMTAVAREGREQVGDLTYRTNRLIDGQGEKQNPFYRVEYMYSTTLASPQPACKRQLRSLGGGGGTFTGDY